MSKATDVEDLLGTAAPAKKTAAKKAPAKTKEAAAEAPLEGKKAVAKKVDKDAAAPAKKAKAAKADPEPATKRVKEPVVFEDGEKEGLIKRVKALSKKPQNSKDLAVKLEIPTRKLRRVLYAAQKQGLVNLELGASPSQGMTVTAC